MKGSHIRGSKVFNMEKGSPDKCGKVYFSDKGRAKKALKKMRRFGCNSVYNCPHCGGWHMTSWTKAQVDIMKLKRIKKTERDNDAGKKK